MKQIMVIIFLGVILLTSGQSFGATAVQTAPNSTNKEKQYTLKPIVVTAKKTEADKQDLPVSISVFDSKMIEDYGLDNLESLVNISPNISMVQTDGVTTQVVFRGVGGLNNMNKLWNTNVDGVIVPYVAIDTMLDVERVEILRGNQGALYGRNTHAGAINIITKDPGDEFNISSTINFESFNTAKINLALGGPINDTIGYRMAIAYKRSDGYIQNDFLNEKDSDNFEQFTGRAKIVLTPNTKNKITFSLYGDTYNAGFDSYQAITNNDISNLKLKTENNEPGERDGYLFSPSLTWEKEFSNFKMVSITNYSNSNYSFLHDWDYASTDFMYATYDENYSTASQELRFSGGDDSNFQWLVGAFGLVESLDTETDINFGADSFLPAGTHAQQNSDIDTYIASTFGQIIYKPFAQFEITGAVRLDYEQKTLNWSNDASNMAPYSAIYGTPPFNIANIKQTKDWFAVSPSLSLAWLFTEKQRVYASISRGFKAGDFNNVMVEAPLVQNAVDPEYLTTYEVGYKGTHFDNRLETNVAFFYIDWDNMQVDIQDSDSILGNFQKVNAGKAHSMGMEIETRALLMPGLEVFANMGYMFEYEFDEFKRDANTDLSGKKLPYVNQYNISIGSVYRNDFGLFLGFDASLHGREYLLENNNVEQDPYRLINAKVGYESDNWDVYLYAKNLLDERYALMASGNSAVVAEPLTVGVQFGVRF